MHSIRVIGPVCHGQRRGGVCVEEPKVVEGIAGMVPIGVMCFHHILRRAVQADAVHSLAHGDLTAV
jgi:hypothetical protein